MDIETCLNVLRCPETQQRLMLASAAQLARLNEAIAAGRLRNRAGQAVSNPLENALVRADGKYAYAMRDGLPVMLVDEGLAMG